MAFYTVKIRRSGLPGRMGILDRATYLYCFRTIYTFVEDRPVANSDLGRSPVSQIMPQFFSYP